MKKLINLAIGIAFLALLAWNPYPFQVLELKSFDWIMSTQEKVQNENILIVDLDEEKKRMLKRINEINRLLMNINGKLSNDNFMQRAPQIVIDKEKSNLNKLNAELEKITINLEMLE